MKPGNAYAHLNLGNQEIALGNRSVGMSQFKLACEASPKDASLLLNVAYALIDDRQTEEAAVFLRRALEVNPDDEEARHSLGQVTDEIEADRSLQAEVTAGEALISTPPGSQDVRARVALANSYRSLGRLTDAAHQLSAALELAPGHPQITQIREEVRAEAAAKAQPAMQGQELVHTTGRFSLFAGKKKGRGKNSPKSSPSKRKGGKSGKVGVAG